MKNIVKIIDMLVLNKKKRFYSEEYSIWELCKNNLGEVEFVIGSLVNKLIKQQNFNRFIERNIR